MNKLASSDNFATCKRCGAHYEKKRSFQKYCSAKCRQAGWWMESAASQKILEIENRLRLLEETLGLHSPQN